MEKIVSSLHLDNAISAEFVDQCCRYLKSYHMLDDDRSG
jgi:hypothetical protein